MKQSYSDEDIEYNKLYTGNLIVWNSTGHNHTISGDNRIYGKPIEDIIDNIHKQLKLQAIRISCLEDEVKELKVKNSESNK